MFLFTPLVGACWQMSLFTSMYFFFFFFFCVCSFFAEPMDLQTMKQKLDNSVYETLDMFTYDLYLIPKNCKTYNKKTTTYYRCAEIFEKKADDLLKKIFSIMRRPPRATRTTEETIPSPSLPAPSVSSSTVSSSSAPGTLPMQNGKGQPAPMQAPPVPTSGSE